MSRKELRITSELKNLNLLEKFVEEICDEFNINNTYFSNINLVMHEAVKNSIVHGNKLDKNKHIDIVFQNMPIGLQFNISDQGDGYDTNNTFDPTDINNKEVEKTGLYLIKSLSDEVKFADNGRTIEIIFKIASVNYEISIKRVNELNLYLKIQKLEEKKNE